VTTVQEAPAIITILTSEELQNRGFRWVEEALATIPGWMNTNGFGLQVPNLPIARGVTQSVLLLRDGISMFDPFANVAVLNRAVPIESLKRIEVVTGPGGVLWGANSFLGVVNMIMKDAEDVNGLEVSAGYGDGPGNKQDIKAYALFGKTFFHGRLKIFQHVSYENWIGQVDNLPQFQFSSPAPQLAGPSAWGPLTSMMPDRSWMVIVDGKYTLGRVSLYYHLPFGEQNQQIGFVASVVPDNKTTTFDRHVALEYADHFLHDRLGLTVRAYWAQFVRQFDSQLFPSSAFFPGYTNPDGTPNIGGVHFLFQPQYSTLIQRAGTTFDFDLKLPYGLRALVGGELFYEGVQGSVETFPSQTYGDPTSAPLPSATPGALPLYCPVMQNAAGSFTAIAACPRTFVQDQYRLVAAGYVDLQYRPIAKLVIDGGVRVQDGFGGRGYGVTPLYSAAVVYHFLPDYHLKLNYSTGFRPPVFNNTDAIGGGVLIAANPNLKNEHSQSFQGELNARFLRGMRRVRELELRLDYSFTLLDDLIQVRNFSYLNTGERRIHSVEALGRLYLNGGHYVTASYSYLYSITSDSGVLRSLPNHTLSLGASFNLVSNLFDVNANVLVTGAYEDPNRHPAYSTPVPGAATGARTTDVGLDRLTPVALLQLGFRLRFFHDRLQLTGQLYNVLNQRYWVADPFYDLTPSAEQTPSPAAGFSCFVAARGRF
jgi:outer membrane receptor protein involved in Fe transport